MISVIIPAYNAERFISETVNSALKQDYSDIELIIVNDGSTDGTLHKVSEIVDSRVRVFTIENGGVSNARNFGFAKSSGDFLAFLDADDVWNEDNITKKVDVMLNESAGLVHSNCVVIDEVGRSLNEVKRGKSGYILDDLLMWKGTCIPAPSSILVRREVIEEVGGFDVSLSTAADQEFFFRVAARYEIGHVDEVTWKYRIHGNNMHQDIKHMEDDHIRAYKIAESYRLFKTWLFKKKCFSNLYLILAGSWWVNQNKHPRTFLLLLRSFWAYPPNLIHMLKRLWQ